LIARVCILTSVHPVFDTRIFHKQAKSLALAGYEVTLIAQHHRDEVVEGIRILALPRPRNRLWRMLGTCRVWRLAYKQHADVYHFHDPELLPVAVLLRLCTRRKIIYDIHENVKGQILTKSWLPRILRRPLSLGYQLAERLSFPFVDWIIIAEDSYIKNYPGKWNISAVRNYPLIPITSVSRNPADTRPTLVYVGAISEGRGVLELIECMRLLKPRHHDVQLTLVGGLQLHDLSQRLTRMLDEYGLADNVHLLGRVNHERVYGIMASCSIGMVILRDEPNYRESLPTKLFEYMAVALPIVSSNFPLWKEVVEGNHCGITADPRNPGEIAKAVEYLVEHTDEAKTMGENGRRAVLEKYSWENESKKLLAIYKDLLEGEGPRQ